MTVVILVLLAVLVVWTLVPTLVPFRGKVVRDARRKIAKEIVDELERRHPRFQPSSSRVSVQIDGDASGLQAAIRSAEADLERLAAKAKETLS